MSRSGLILKEPLSDREHTRRAILAVRLQRTLAAFARRHGHNPEQLCKLAERVWYLCPICARGIPIPHVYSVGGEPRAVMCGRCFVAITKVDGDFTKLRRHWRFNHDQIRNRGRLGRLIDLHTEGSWLHPAQPLGDLVEQERAGAHRESSDDAEEKRVPA